MRHVRHIFATIAVLFAALMGWMPTSAGANAPGDTELSLLEIGGPVSSDIAFAPLTIDVPVVAGLHPTMVSGKVAVSGAIPSGAVMAVDDQGWSTPIGTGGFNIAITNGQALSLVLRTTVSELVTCDGGTLPRVVVTDLSVRYDGTATPPDHIGSFFPPVMRRVTVVVPDTPIAFSSAALRVATSLTRRYGRATNMAFVTQRPTNQPFAPFERVIVLEEGAPATMAVDGDALVLTGNGEQVMALADRLDDPILRTITTPKFDAKALPAPVERPMIGDSFSIDRLRSKTSTATSSTTLQLTLDEEMFEKPPAKISLKLNGRAVVAGAGQGAASVTVRVDGEAIQSDPLDPSGRFTASLDISGFDHRRFAAVEIEVAVNRTGCTGAVPSIELNQKSSGKVTGHAEPPTGFPGITRRWKSKPVAGVNSATLGLAATILSSIQETSPNPIHPTAVANPSSSVIFGFALTSNAVAEADVAATPIGEVDGLARVMPDGTLVVRTSSAEAIDRLLTAARRAGWSGLEGDLMVVEDDGSESVSWQEPRPESRASSTSSGADATTASDAAKKAKGLTPMRSAVLGGTLCVLLFGVKLLTAKRRG
jgi:hypothetical protein